MCQCAEGSIAEPDGTKVETGLHVHDCAYIDQRNRLIPLAEGAAGRDVADRNSASWSHAFHKHMNRLAELKIK
jgi:hypothetical protein